MKVRQDRAFPGRGSSLLFPAIAPSIDNTRLSIVNGSINRLFHIRLIDGARTAMLGQLLVENVALRVEAAG
ncbi:MAG: hypothetical protein AB7E66_11365 [Parvibaculaceae bacterium]